MELLNSLYEQEKTFKLIRAIWYKFPFETIKNIIDTSQDINLDLPDAIGCTPLGQALTNNDAKIVELLLEKGANPNIKTRGTYPLFYAIENGNISILNLLVKFGVDLNVKEKDNDPLFHSLGYNSDHNLNTEIFKMLVDLGCDLNYKNSNGHSVLLICTYWNQTELVEYIFQSSNTLDVNEFDIEEHNGNEYKFSIFYYACYNSNEKLAKLFIEKNVDCTDVLNLISNYGETLEIKKQTETDSNSEVYVLEKEEDGNLIYVLKKDTKEQEDDIEIIDFKKIVCFANEMINKYKKI
jgi:ankyrin repeat protein